LLAGLVAVALLSSFVVFGEALVNLLGFGTGGAADAIAARAATLG